MNLEELLKLDRCTYGAIHDYVVQTGIANISIQDLDKIIKRFGSDVFIIEGFYNLYSMVSANESNNTIRKWTITTGIMTVIVTIATVINLFLYIGTQ